MSYKTNGYGSVICHFEIQGVWDFAKSISVVKVKQTPNVMHGEVKNSIEHRHTQAQSKAFAPSQLASTKTLVIELNDPGTRLANPQKTACTLIFYPLYETYSKLSFVYFYLLGVRACAYTHMHLLLVTQSILNLLILLLPLQCFCSYSKNVTFILKSSKL